MFCFRPDRLVVSTQRCGGVMTGIDGSNVGDKFVAGTIAPLLAHQGVALSCPDGQGPSGFNALHPSQEEGE